MYKLSVTNSKLLTNPGKLFFCKYLQETNNLKEFYHFMSLIMSLVTNIDWTDDNNNVCLMKCDLY